MDELTDIFETAWTFIGARDASAVQLGVAATVLHYGTWRGIHAVGRMLRAASEATSDLTAEPTGKRRKR